MYINVWINHLRRKLLKGAQAIGLFCSDSSRYRLQLKEERTPAAAFLEQVQIATRSDAIEWQRGGRVGVRGGHNYVGNYSKNSHTFRKRDNSK